MSLETLANHLRIVPDFPKKGIQFYDITTLLKDPECIREVVDILYEHYKDKGITKVVGMESRGFLFGPALAIRLGAGFVLARKPGKLPAETYEVTYTKEYGSDTIQIHKDAITEDDTVLLHDDLLATGGTMVAGLDLMKQFNPKKVYVNFLIELVCEGLHGRDAFPQGTDIYTVMTLG